WRRRTAPPPDPLPIRDGEGECGENWRRRTFWYVVLCAPGQASQQIADVRLAKARHFCYSTNRAGMPAWVLQMRNSNDPRGKIDAFTDFLADDAANHPHGGKHRCAVSAAGGLLVRGKSARHDQHQ